MENTEKVKKAKNEDVIKKIKSGEKNNNDNTKTKDRKK